MGDARIAIMSTDLVVIEPRQITPTSISSRILNAWRQNKAESTLRTYAASLKHFRKFCGVPTSQEALESLLVGKMEATEILMDYVDSMKDASPSTVRSRVAAVLSILDIANELDVIKWKVKIRRLPKAEIYRDTAGPRTSGFTRIVAYFADASGNIWKTRDRAMVMLMAMAGLRRAEVVSLDINHVDVKSGVIMVLGKGHRQRKPVPISTQLIKWLSEWMDLRRQYLTTLNKSSSNQTALFLSHRRGKAGNRLVAHGLYQIVKAISRKTDLKLWPHALRHFGITKVITDSGNPTMAAAFARHADLRVTLRYVDNLQDQAKAAADIMDKAAEDAAKNSDR